MLLEYIANNLATIIIAAIVFSVLALVIIKLIKDKRNHRSSCGCGCENCPSAKICHRD